MYLSKITIENFRCFGEGANRLELPLKPGLTALVGENDTGKTAVIDALRFVLGTRDQEWYRLEDADFYRGATSREIRIICKFEGLTARDKRAFVEYLTYSEENEDKPVLYLHWTAKDTKEITKGRPYRRVDVRSGKNGDGPSLAPEVRELLRATYLRPLRDADQALSSGRGSRLSQVLHHTDQIKKTGVRYDPKVPTVPEELNVLGIGDFANALLEKQKGIAEARKTIDNYLDELSLYGNALKSGIKVSGANASDDMRLRQLLEKLELITGVEGKGEEGKLGLGSNNLLFIACELLLLAQEDEGNKLLLIEEPEAHLHPQRQLRVMKNLQNQAKQEGKDIQIIVTTHSPNLASAIELNNIVMIHDGRAFSMAEEETELASSDYRFLERFLDVTKALTRKQWDNCCDTVREIAEIIAGASLSSPEADAFLGWEDGPDGSTPPHIAPRSRDNIYRYPHDAPKVLIHVGSIHSVKGQTHTATLVLETFWHKHNLHVLLPWLYGSNSGGQSDGVRQQVRLKLHYVAMTRLAHLLCLAMKRNTFEDAKGNLDQEVMEKLQQRGWQVRLI